MAVSGLSTATGDNPEPSDAPEDAAMQLGDMLIAQWLATQADIAAATAR